MRETELAPAEGAEAADKVHPVRFTGEQWSLLERAAEKFGEREHMKTTATDIIRSGAIRRAEEILGVTEAVP